MKKMCLFFVFLLVGCTALGPAAPKVDTAKIIAHIHDLDTETTFAYNDFDDDYVALVDLTDNAGTLEDIKSVQAKATETKEGGKVAIVKFQELLAAINETKLMTFSDSERAYISKLELASVNYIATIEGKVGVADDRVKWGTLWVHMNIWNTEFNRVLQADTRAGQAGAVENWDATLTEFNNMQTSLGKARTEIDLMKQTIPFAFFDHYYEWIQLIGTYAENQKVIVDKLKNGRTVTEAEFQESLKPAADASNLMVPDSENVFYVEGEKDQTANWQREHLTTPEERANEFYNKADAYYGDAKLYYEQLIKNTPTGQATANISAST